MEVPLYGHGICARTLAPCWSNVLDQTDFLAFQASSHGGTLKVRLTRNRVLIARETVVVATGDLRIS